MASAYAEIMILMILLNIEQQLHNCSASNMVVFIAFFKIKWTDILDIFLQMSLKCINIS